MSWLYWTPAAALGLASLTLLVWSLVWDRPRGRLRCPKCWYDMAGASSLTCPECGKTAKRESKLRKTRRRWAFATLGVLLAFGALGLGVTPQVQRGGWLSLGPSSLLIEAAAHDPIPGSLLSRELANRSESFTRNQWDRLETVLRRRIERSRDPEEWRIVAYMMGDYRMQRQLPHLGETFLDGIRDGDVEVRRVAVSGAALCMPSPYVARRAFIDALGDDDPDVRQSAAWAFIRYDTHAEPMSEALPILRAMALDSQETPQTRAYAVTGIMHYEHYDESLTPAILELTHAQDWVVRSTAIRRLQYMSEPTPEVLARLRELLADPHPGIRGPVAWVLASFGDDESIDLIIPLLDDPDWTVQCAAASSLAEFGASAALPRLRELAEMTLSLGEEESNDRFTDAISAAIDRIELSLDDAPDP